MTTAREEFANSLQMVLVVLQAIILVGFVGIMASDPDPMHLFPFFALNSYLLVLIGAALIYFRREYAAWMQRQAHPRLSFAREPAWLEAAGRRHGWLIHLFGVRATPESFGLRGIFLLSGGMLMSILTLVALLWIATG